MASIEARPGKRATSYRVIWVHKGQRKSASFKSQQAAENWKHLIEQTDGDQDAAERALLKSASAAPLLSEVAELHMSRLIDVAPFTLRTYRQTLRLHLHPLDVPVDTITEDDVARWVSWMQREGKQTISQRTGEVVSRSGYSPKTIKNSHGFLYSVLQFAIKRGHIKTNPAADTRLPRKGITSERDKFLTVEEFYALLPHVPQKYQPHALFLFFTGMRAGEMLALTPEDFTVADGVTYVTVNKAVKHDADGKTAIIGEPKTTRSRRRIDVDEATMGHVWPLIRAAAHGEQVFKVPKPHTSVALYKCMWKPAMQRAKDAGFTKSPTVHSLRHSHASNLLALGFPMHEVSRRLGHSSLSFTDAVYTHMTPARQSAASALLSAQIPAASTPPSQLEAS
ncbi:tyrosine-type recombinase/integrase [Nesterenkonia lacusekhoensis]|uniref:Integrase n=1 Tax=Nesterenkonia lacusekhoensis TaxID=150832 RepID=A0ABS4SYZ3_9MICC|nr:site-specific integrase [Nesterenkonia lacusekhoensis]MBP2317415.1 integrase [Nesterenkonia lacusekhoensis]